MSGHTFRYPDAPHAAEACAKHILTLLEEASAGEAHATLAISGGSSPRLMFEIFAKTRFPWERVELFWVDERAVPPTDSQSNFKLANDAWLATAHFPSRNIHRIHAELSPEAAAHRYADEIRSHFHLAEGAMPHFDVIHRGMGPDAHTASLFPGEPLIDDRSGLAAAVWVEKMGQWRITLLPGVLLAARHTVMMVTGADKADALRQVFNEPYDAKKYPAQITSHHGRGVAWFLDEAAAAKLD
jgi:6-phosphogluconolactonase